MQIARTNGIYKILSDLYHDKIIPFKRKVNYYKYTHNISELMQNRKKLRVARKRDNANLRVKNPLVSIRIPTYNLGQVLVERTIPSVLSQTYNNIEIIVVGDHCTDNTEELLRKLHDPRIHFYNLPDRGDYPAEPYYRWLVAGVVPANRAIDLCSGDWIAPLDDDDEFSPDHIEILLNFALEHCCEMVYGKIQMELTPNKWVEIGSYPPKYDNICHLSVLYKANLKFFKYDINSWRYKTGADINMWMRMIDAGVKVGFVNKVVGRHYLEGKRRGL